MASVYEKNKGEALKQVEGYCRHLTQAGVFGDTSHPTRDWVVTQLNLDASYIGVKLEEAGYSATQTDADALQLLQAWNTVRTVIAVELSNPVESISGRGNARFQEFINREKAIEATVLGAGFADVGAGQSGGLGSLLTATGVSFARKQTVEDDSDHIKHRFRKGQFVHPSTSDPTAETQWEDQ